jgi:transcriptional activator
MSSRDSFPTSSGWLSSTCADAFWTSSSSRALAAQGNVAEAMLVHVRLRCLLRDELGTAPSHATQELYSDLLSARA